MKGALKQSFTLLSTAQIPGRVQNLVINNIQQWGFTAAWNPPATGNTAEFYNVTITNTNTNDVYERSLLPNDDGSYEIDHLYDDTTYTFSVVAVNHEGQGGSSVENTGINIPPCQLCLSSANVGSSFFQLMFPATGVNTILSGRTVDASTQLNGPQRAMGPSLTSIFYLGLQGGLLYELQMTDSNTQAIVYSSRYRTVPWPVTNLLLSPESSTSVHVTYEQPIGTQYHKYDGFRITYGDQERFVGSSDTSLVIDGLQAGISYIIEVQTFSGELADRTYSVPAAGDITIVDLFLEANATTSLSVAWALPSIEVSGFQIRYSILGASSFTTLPFGPTVTTATLENLEPGQIYRINLYIVTAEGTDLLTEAEFQTIPDVVSDILGETMDTSIALSWTPPPGEADYYLVMYDPIYGSTITPSEASNPEFNIKGLDPGIEYEVSIISVAGSALSSAASETFMTDLGDTSLIRLKEITATSLSVTWSPNQFATTYTVSISPNAGNPVFIVPSSNRLFAEFAGLSEGTLYTVTLVATPSSSSPLTADFKTNPSPPGTISPSNVLPRSATLSWGASSGADEYSITVSSGENVIVEMRTADLSVDLTELEPETVYSVVIFAESTQQGLTSQSGEQSVDFETLPAVISLGTITTTSVLVLGTLDTQRIEYTPSGGSFISGSPGVQGTTFLGGLTPGQEYTITITVDSANVDQVTFFTYPEVPQGVRLTLSDPDTSSVLVEYDAPMSGLHDGYLITYAGASVGSGGNEPSPITAKASSTQTTITGLTPGTVYTVTVQSIVNDGNTVSSTTTRSISTEGGADASFYVFSKTTNSIIIKFAQIGGSNTATATEQNGPATNGDETNGQFTFVNLTPGTVYDVTLIISRAGQSAVTTSQMVQTLPNTPTSLAAVSSDESPAITVTWQPVDGGVSSYRVRLILPAGGDETSLLIIAGLDTSYVFDDVQPSTEYDVTVTAVARDEALEEESYPATVQVTTDPRTFTFTINTTSFVLSFEAVDGALAYEMYDGIHHDSQQFITLPYRSLTDYQPGSLLQVTVFALTSTGETLLVGSQDVLLKPEQVSDFSLTATVDTFTVSGINPGNGLVDIIEIEYGTEGLAYILPSVSEKKIEFLQQSTSYPVRVYAVVYAGGLSQRSDVREKTTVTQTGLRASPVVTEITTNTITIGWTEFTPYTQHIFIQEKDTDVILEEASYVTADQTTIHTFNVQPATLYRVTIETISSGGIIIETNLKDVRSLPEAVTFAQMTSVDLTSIALIWDIPDDARSDGFEVRVLPPPSPGNYPIIVNDQVFTVRSLRPGTVYDIQVLSLSGQADNCQTFGTPFQIVTTTESLDVFEIVAVDIYDTRASVEFSATNLMFQDVNEYEIAVTPSAGGMAQIITVTKGIYTADITDLIGGTSYDVLLSAVLLNNEKDNDTATTTFVTSPQPPGNVAVTEETTSTITLSWSPPSQGQFFGYILEYEGTGFSTELGRTPGTSVLPRTQESVTLKGLTPGTSYSIKISSFVEYVGVRTRSNIVTSLGTTMSTSSLNIVAKFVNQTSFTIEWQPAVGASSYVTRVSEVTSGVEISSVTNVSGDYERTEHRLVPGRNYQIEVSATGTGQSDTVEQRTLPSAVSDVDVVPEAAALTLSWDPVFGDVDGYYAFYQLKEDPYQISDLFYVSDLSNPMVRLTGLSPISEYIITVTSFSGSGSDQEISSSTVEASTVNYSPAEIVIETVTSTSIALSWGASTSPTASSYVIEASDAGNVVHSTSRALSQSRFIIFTSLTPGTLYTIRITVTGSSEQDIETAITVPTAPRSLSTDSISQSIVTVSWSQGLGNVDEYDIYLRQAGESEMPAQIVPPSQLTQTFENLEPATDYSMRIISVVRAQDLEQRSIPAVTNFTTQPRIINVAETGRNLRLSWANDFGNDILKYQLIYIEDKEGATSNSEFVGPSDAPSVTLMNLMPGQTYTLILTAVRFSGNRAQIASTTYTLKPLRPTFTVNRRSPSAVSLLGNLLGGILKFFRMRVTPQVTGAGAGTSINIDVLIPVETCPEIELSGLIPNTDYQVTLQAESGVASSDPQIITFTTPPLTQQGQLSFGEVTPSGFTVFWSPFMGLTSYEFSINQAQHVVPALGDAVQSYVVDDLSSGTQYTVSLVDGGTGTIRTRPLSPETPIATQVLDTSIQLQWTQSSDGNVAGYEICYSPDDGSSPVHIAGRTTTQYTLEGLNSDTTYIISISALTGNQDQVKSQKQTIFVATIADTTIPVASNFAVTNTQAADHVIILEWDVPERASYDYFEVSYTPDVGYPSSPVRLPKAATSLSIMNALADKVYQFSLVSIRGDERTDPPLTTTGQIAVNNLIVVIGERTTTSLEILWGASASGSVNEYQVSYVGSTPIVVDGSSDRRVVIPGLSPGTEYTVTVQAINAGASVGDSMETASTLHEMHGLSAMVTDQASSMIHLTITPPFEDPMRYDGYNVRVRLGGVSSPVVQPVIRVAKSACPEIWIKKLEAPTMYEINIEWYSGLDISEAFRVQTSTVAAAPLDITLDELETDSMKVTWQEGTGSFSNYLVTYSPVGSTQTPMLVARGEPRVLDLSGLVPGTAYTIMVQQQGQTPAQETHVQLTLPEAINSLSVTPSTNALDATWSAPSTGNYDGYRVCHYPRGTQSSPYTLGNTRTSINLPGLNSLTYYLVTVSSSEESTYSEPTTITQQTQSLGVFESLGVFVAVGIHDTRVLVEFSATNLMC